jgi:hypothetical protein
VAAAPGLRPFYGEALTPSPSGLDVLLYACPSRPVNGYRLRVLHGAGRLGLAQPAPQGHRRPLGEGLAAILAEIRDAHGSPSPDWPGPGGERPDPLRHDQADSCVPVCLTGRRSPAILEASKA